MSAKGEPQAANWRDWAPKNPPFQEYPNERTEVLVAKAKRAHRGDLSVEGWKKYGYVMTNVCEKFAIPIECVELERFNSDDVTHDEFVRRFEEPNVPCVFSGACDHWKAREDWTFQELGERYRNRYFKVGEDDDGYRVKLKMKHLLRYLNTQRDDSPLYVFDSNFDDDRKAKAMLEDFDIPKYFREDLFSLVGEERRPPHRWFLIGPKRSGTCVHIDPLATSAWNALIRGRKRWALFPPTTSKRLVKGKHLRRKGEDDEAIDWFNNILPRIKEEGGDNLRCIEFIQYPGETCFIPGGWWHAVLNLDDTVAVTQNFVSSTNFPRVWRATRVGRKKMAKKFLRRLSRHHPELVTQALQLNEADGFVMETGRFTDGSKRGEYRHELRRQEHRRMADEMARRWGPLPGEWEEGVGAEEGSRLAGDSEVEQKAAEEGGEEGCGEDAEDGEGKRQKVRGKHSRRHQMTKKEYEKERERKRQRRNGSSSPSSSSPTSSPAKPEHKQRAAGESSSCSSSSSSSSSDSDTSNGEDEERVEQCRRQLKQQRQSTAEAECQELRPQVSTKKVEETAPGSELPTTSGGEHPEEAAAADEADKSCRMQ